MASVLLTTKLYFPPARQGLVPRPRLTSLLERGLSMPLTLVSAPAGYGKTSLLSDWRAGVGQDFPCAWLSLDSHDNDLSLFLEYILAALESLDPSLAGDLASMLRLPILPPVEELLTALINAVSSFPQNFALILDDYHTITDLKIHTALAYLLDHLPVRMHIILLTRSDPPLPLARLLARNQLTEIREEQLRFTLDEAAAFLKQAMGLDLRDEDVRVLERRTEGWIAGLQMAGLSLQNRRDITEFISAFQGDDRYVMDYLMEEVFNNQPPEIQEFLLHTAILDRLCPAICDALTQASSVHTGASSHGSHSILKYLERNNLFLLPLDNRREWYRYHHLFADLLRYRLQRERPELIPELHRKACLWFKQSGDGDEAMKHALAIPDHILSAEVAETFMMTMIGSSRIAAYSGWVQRIPQDIILSRPYLCAGCGWVSLLLAWQPDQADAYAAAGEAALPQFQALYNAPAGRWITPEEVRGHLTAIRAHAARMRGDYPAAVELSQQALAELPEAVYAVRCILAFNLGLLYMGMGSLDQARTACLEAIDTALKSGENNNIALNALSVLAGISVWRGRLYEAEEHCRRAFLVGGESGGQAPDLAVAYAHGWLTEVHMLRNELEVASTHLEKAIRNLEHIGAQENLAYGYCYQARLAIEQGELARAEIQVQQIAGMARSKAVAENRAAEWAIIQGMLLLAQGKLPETAQWLDSQGVKAGDLPQVSQLNAKLFQRLRTWLPAYLLLARLSWAQGSPDQAMKLLENVAAIAQAMQNHGVLLEALVFQAVILSSQRTRQTEALNLLERSLRMAAKEGYVQPFLHAGYGLVPLLRQAIIQAVEPAYAQNLLKALNERQRQASIQSNPHAMGQAAGAAHIELIEPLTEREKQVLRLMAAGLTSTQIASELVISVSTARSYIKSLHQKLDAHSREEALERGIQFGLL